METNIYHLKSPIEIITTELGITQEYNQQCIDEIYHLGDSMNNKSNVKAIMSSYTIWKETDKLNLLIDKIIETISGLIPPPPGKKYLLKDCWSVLCKTSHFVAPHSHEPGNRAFVYYLKTDEFSSPLIFNDCNFKIKPLDDLLLIFPSNITHSVPSQKEGDDRICISGNLDLFPKNTTTLEFYNYNINNRE